MTSKVDCGNQVRANRGINNLKKLRGCRSETISKCTQSTFKRTTLVVCDGDLAAYCPGPDAPRCGTPWACVLSIKEWKRSRCGPINTSDSPVGFKNPAKLNDQRIDLHCLVTKIVPAVAIALWGRG